MSYTTLSCSKVKHDAWSSAGLITAVQQPRTTRAALFVRCSASSPDQALRDKLSLHSSTLRAAWMITKSLLLHSMRLRGGRTHSTTTMSGKPALDAGEGSRCNALG